MRDFSGKYKIYRIERLESYFFGVCSLGSALHMKRPENDHEIVVGEENVPLGVWKQIFAIWRKVYQSVRTQSYPPLYGPRWLSQDPAGSTTRTSQFNVCHLGEHVASILHLHCNRMAVPLADVSNFEQVFQTVSIFRSVQLLCSGQRAEGLYSMKDKIVTNSQLLIYICPGKCWTRWWPLGMWCGTTEPYYLIDIYQKYAL